MNPQSDLTPAFVAYYRLSKEKKDRKGKVLTAEDAAKLEALGILAQREAITKFVSGRGGQIVSEYREIESGKRHENRPQLQAALAECKRRKATLVIARLDRLARNVAFISGLMESGIDFVACDNPQASKFTIHILAAVAEHEREMISQRTVAALEQKKKELEAVGRRLGPPDPVRNLQAAWKARTQPLPPAETVEKVLAWDAEGKGYAWIARELNRLRIQPSKGAKAWHPPAVQRLLRRLQAAPETAA